MILMCIYIYIYICLHISPNRGAVHRPGPRAVEAMAGGWVYYYFDYQYYYYCYYYSYW